MAEKCNDRWKSTLQEIIDFHKRYGRLPSKFNSNDSEKRLAYWRIRNVLSYKKGRLSRERAGLIESSGIVSEWDDRIWLDMLERTKKFVKLHGRYPSGFAKSAEEKKCGYWRGEQARLLRGNRLKPNRKQLFEESGLTKTMVDKQWDLMLKKVVQFKKENGRMPSRDASTQGELKLARWCYKYTRALKDKSINRQQARLLEAAGIPDSQKKDDPWQEQYDKLKEFCEKNSRFPLRKRGVNDYEKKLYEWFFNQQTRIKSGRVDVEKVNKIKEIKKKMIPPRVIARERNWMDKYRKVSDFKEKHNRLPGSSRNKIEESKLFRWLQNQKLAFKKGALEPKYLNLLKKCIGNDKLLSWFASSLGRKNTDHN